MSNHDTIEVRVTKGSVLDLPSIDAALTKTFYLEPEHLGPGFVGCTRLSADGEALDFYLGTEGLDDYGFLLEIYCPVDEVWELLSQALQEGQLLGIYRPDGQPTELALILPGQVLALTADNIGTSA